MRVNLRGYSQPDTGIPMTVKGQRTEGVAFRVIARTRVDADEPFFWYGAGIDATPWDGTDISALGCSEP